MFNVYAFDKRSNLADSVRSQKEKQKKNMVVHRRIRDLMAENYQRRVKNFIRDMAEGPVKQNDEYTNRLTFCRGSNYERDSSCNASKLSQTYYNGSEAATKYDNNGKMRSHSTKIHKTSKSTSDGWDVPLRDFRYTNFRTEKERIAANIKSNQQF